LNHKRATTDICYVVSFGFAARMLLQTGLLERLLVAGKSVAVITPDAEHENLRALLRYSGFSLHEAAAVHGLWHDNYLFKRKYYLEDIRANPALWEKHVYSLRYSKSLHPWRRVRPLYYLLIYYLIKLFPGIRRRFLVQEKRYLQSEQISALLQEIQPRLVVATYPVNILEAQVMYAAKQAHLPTVLQLLSWDNITSKGRFPVVAEHYVLWGPIMSQELLSYYPEVAPAQIRECGVPHFDHYEAFRGGSRHRSRLAYLGLDPDRPYLFFAMSAERFAPREIDIVEQLSAAIRANVFGPDLQLVVRPHPQVVSGHMTDKSWLGRLERLVGERVAVDWPRLLPSNLRWSMHREDMDQLAALLAGCTLCLNSGSTISIEALLLDKPVILTAFDAEDQLPYWQSARRLVDYVHLRKLVELGGITVAHSKADLAAAITQYLREPEHLRHNRQATIAQECYATDGQATARTVTALLNLLEEKRPERTQDPLHVKN